jgi:hypothetical protein
MVPAMTFLRASSIGLLVANCWISACGGGGSGTSGETTTTTDPSTTTTESTSTTTETSVSPETTSSGPGLECPFYNFENPPAANVGADYEFVPSPSNDPAWTPTWSGEVPGLVFGATIAGVPETEGRYPIEGYLENADGLTCQREMYTLVVGPPLPADSSGTDSSGTDSSGTDSSGTDSSGSESSGTDTTTTGV